MSTNFDWQTDDDLVWDESAEHSRPVRPHRPSWLTLIALTALLGVSIWVVGREAQQRIEMATVDATADILASHNVVRAAAAQADCCSI